MLVTDLISYLNQLLNISAFQDYCPNGLQVAGKPEIKKIITGVTACQALLDAAVAQNADAVLVHHGYFWKGENPSVVGLKQRYLKTLLTHDINLLAYHLPLDAHPIYGNNALLGKKLEFTVTDILDNGLFYVGSLSQPQTPQQLHDKIAKALHRSPQLVKINDNTIKTIAWCTGAAQDFINKAAELKVGAYLSGEISERTFHLAHEYEINYFAAGHHATETFGVQALGQHLAKEFSLTVEFVDIHNPV
jgi:dinuclear metal center YbgI/SA1388 family protein